MKYAAPAVEAKRAYRQTARAEAAAATAERILDAFATRLRHGWLDEIRLEDVAQDAGVTVQTVIRRFGGKDGLLDAVHERLTREIDVRRDVPPGDIASAVRALSEDYEAVGGFVIRALAQEDRYPAMRRMTDGGRSMHRAWVARVFNPWLQDLSRAAVQARLDALVVATDIYVWKLIRADLGRPPSEYESLARTLIAAALAHAPAPESR